MFITLGPSSAQDLILPSHQPLEVIILISVSSRMDTRGMKGTPSATQLTGPHTRLEAQVCRALPSSSRSPSL